MNNELFLLAIQSIRGKKKSNFLLMGILFISLVFTTVTLSVTDSFNKTNANYRYDVYGSWKAAVYNGTEKDIYSLKKCEIAEEIGTARAYGTVCGSTAIGTVDNSLINMGHLTMQEGDFPKNPGEIAMEANLLSNLGYDYQLGQNIQIDIQTGPETTVTKKYRLCGVLKHYSDLWIHDTVPLVGAILTPEDAKELTNTPVYHYFMSSPMNVDLVYQNLMKCKNAARDTNYTIMKNIYAYPTIQKEREYHFYLALILATSVAAVGCVYLIQIQDQIRSIALFRSIGGTKEQLIKILFYETSCILLPCIAFGIPVGILGLWMIFTFFMKISFVKFYISLPVSILLVAVILWFTAIFLCRVFILFIAMRQPLVGRIRMSVRNKKIQRRCKEIFTALLAGMFAAILLFTVIQALPEINEKNRLEGNCAYSITARERTLGSEEQEMLKEIPGVQELVACGTMVGQLTFPGMKDNALAMVCMDNKSETQPYLAEKILPDGTVHTTPFPEGIGVHITGISEKYLQEFLNPLPSNFDLEKFRSGKQAYIIFYTNMDHEIQIEGNIYTDTGIHPGDKVNITFYSDQTAENGKTEELKKPEKTGSYSLEAGAVIKTVWEKQREFVGNRAANYNILVSNKFLQKVLSESKPDRHIAFHYMTGRPYGDTNMNIYTSSNASYLSTDYVVADTVQKYGAHMENYREKNTAQIMEHIQNLLSLFSVGGSISLTLLLILWDTVTLTAEKNKKTYGILQAIGMSKNKMRRIILGKGLNLGIFSIAFSIGTYLLYQTGLLIEEQKNILSMYEKKENIQVLIKYRYEYLQLNGLSLELLMVFGICIIVLFVILYYIGNRHLLKTTPIEKLNE